MPRQVALGAKIAKLIKFFRRKPPQNLSDISHDKSLRAECLKE
jgi:hypothetical protein